MFACANGTAQSAALSFASSSPLAEVWTRLRSAGASGGALFSRVDGLMVHIDGLVAQASRALPSTFNSPTTTSSSNDSSYHTVSPRASSPSGLFAAPATSQRVVASPIALDTVTFSPAHGDGVSTSSSASGMPQDTDRMTPAARRWDQHQRRAQRHHMGVCSNMVSSTLFPSTGSRFEKPGLGARSFGTTAMQRPWQQQVQLNVAHTQAAAKTPPAAASAASTLRPRPAFFSSQASDRKLEALFDSAEQSPNDPVKQAAFLKVLAAADPEACVQRFESEQYASNQDCVKAYLSALVTTDRLQRTDISHLFAGTAAPAPGSFENLTRQNFSNRQSHGNHQSYNAGQFEYEGSHREAPVHVVLEEPSFRTWLIRMARFAVIAVFAWSLLKEAADQSGGLVGRGMSTQHEIRPEADTRQYSFDDVQGADEAKEELKDIVAFLQRPEDFTRLGGRLPRGVLLMGPPGTGKTLLARAIAGEAGVPFFYCSGSEFDEMFVGVGARRVRDLFAAAKKKSPCIIFMDEIDAVGGRRNAKDQQYIKMTLNQLLVELDGFTTSDGVIVIGATNFPETLDPALTRPGRFDTHIKVPLPDIRGREKILKVHSKNIPIQKEEDLWTIARGTPGFSGAELANLVNQAALRASQERHEDVDLKTLEWAKDKILMGAERKQAVITEQDRKVTAYHEGGHALCALFTEGATPVYKATIIPRGNALGMVTQLPEDDTNSLTRQQMMARLVVCMGGRAAEEKIFGHKNVTSGASSDVEQATRLARAMVTKYAMSEKVGPVLIDEQENISDATRELVESEIKHLLQTALEEANAILTKYEREHHRLAKALLEYETLTAEEMRLICDGRRLPR
eukprot:m.101451 g.101451  ORF g.101451 m.101451 type:complete len:852 (-) comp15459_c0_seq1:111-2666(-)